MSTTPNLLISHIASSQNQKEVTANTAFDDLDGTITGQLTVAMADADQTPSADQAHYNSMFLCTGALTANRKLVVPLTKKYYLVKNNTTGGHAINVIGSTGTGILVAAGDGYTLVYGDGTNVNLIGTFGGIANGSNTTADFLNQSAAIALTTLLAVPSGADGLYAVSYVAKIKSTDTVSCVLGGANGFQVKYTDVDDSTTPTTLPGPTSAVNATTTVVEGVVFVYAKGGTNIQFSFDYTTGSGAPSTIPMAYNLHIRVKKV